MTFGRVIVRLVLACFLGTFATLLLFASLAFVIDGRLQAGSFHSGVAASLLSAPIFWGSRSGGWHELDFLRADDPASDELLAAGDAWVRDGLERLE